LTGGFGFAPDENAALDEQVIEEDRIHELEFDVMREGELRTLSDVKFPIRDHSGEIVAIGGIEVDITERKRAEDNLQKSRERLQALADNLPEFISMKDSDGKENSSSSTSSSRNGSAKAETTSSARRFTTFIRNSRRLNSTPWTGRRSIVDRICRKKSTLPTQTARRGPSFAPGFR
jgi:transcriptional regulator with PAS, ATPase and Fis domain